MQNRLRMSEDLRIKLADRERKFDEAVARSLAMKRGFSPAAAGNLQLT